LQRQCGSFGVLEIRWRFRVTLCQYCVLRNIALRLVLIFVDCEEEKIMPTYIHMSLSVKGALMNFSKKDLSRMFKHEDGRRYTADEAKKTLLDELSQGHEFIPIGKCDNFDYKKGCMGHKSEVVNIIKTE
jgi:hypothetical protein